MKAAVCALLVSLVATSLAAAGPQFPPLTGRVVDQAGILSHDTEQDLARLLEAFETKSGVQLVVATVTDLGGEDLDTYSVDLARHWQIGQKGKNNGAVLLVAPTEHAIKIEVGYGLEGQLTDALASEIIHQRMLPAFRRGDYDGGVREGVQAIIEVVGGEYQSASPAKSHSVRQNIPVGVFWLLMILLLLGGIGGGRRRGLRSVARAAAWGIMLGGMGGGRRGGGYGGDFGSGGGGFGGGGFKGGGGSFGGGGASGRW